MANNKLIHLAPTFYQYIESLKENDQINTFKGVDFYLKKFNLLKSIIDLLPCVVYILDYRTRKYLYMSENTKTISGFDASDYINGGLDFQMSRLHPDDLNVFTSKVFSEFIAYSRTIPNSDLKKTVFSLNCRCKRKDDAYIQFLQQYVVLERDKLNNPFLTLGVVTDITPFKADNRMIFSVTMYNENGRDLKIYSPHSSAISQVISKREIEILKLVLKGHTSKKIAETMHLSYYTVRAHRRKLMEKTNCKNAAELGSYALSNGLV